MKTLQAGIVVLLTFFVANYSFAQCERQPLQAALDAMDDDAVVTVTTVTVGTEWDSPKTYVPKDYYEFAPATGPAPTEALILYPGGDVDTRAYAPMARDIAAQGYLVVLVTMPDCLALFGKDRADAIIDDHPEITTWSIGGHSMGGVTAPWYIDGSFTYSDKIDGLVLWAAYPADSAMLLYPDLKVVSIYGTEDNNTKVSDIDDSRLDLPADTRWAELEGANHTQFGYYGADAGDDTFLQPGDNPATITRQEQQDLIVNYTVSFLDSLTPNTPPALETVSGDDGSTWERLSAPGLGDTNNQAVIALQPYQNSMYALVRNDVSGFELWKSTSAGWERLTVAGFTDVNDFYGYYRDYTTGENRKFNLNMSIWGSLIEFKGHLYVAVSTGYQGAALYGTLGFQVWRSDGVTWEPVFSRTEYDESGIISSFTSCTSLDGSYDADFVDASADWSEVDLTGCILEIEGEYTDATHGETGVSVPGIRRLEIISNTATSLKARQYEKALSDKYTVCTEHSSGGDPGRATNLVAAISVGDAYTVHCGPEGNGNGELWNKSIVDMEELNGELFISIGLNYEDGAKVLRSSDGMNWVDDSAYSFGNIHGYDWNTGLAVPAGQCFDPDKETKRDQAVSSSFTSFAKTSVTGTETLILGGTGTSGCNGRGARIYRRDGALDWLPIVDAYMDTDAIGSNENGFGWDSSHPITGEPDFFYSAFQAWSFAEYGGRLFVAVAKLEAGGFIYDTASAAGLNDDWDFSMGGYDADPLDSYSNGFGDVLNTGGYLYNYNDVLYVGSLVTNMSLDYPNEPLNGADLWRGTGSADNIQWTKVNDDGFGDSTVLSFESFTEFDSALYVSASTAQPSNFYGQEPVGASGATIYRMVDDGGICEVTADCSAGEECVLGSCEVSNELPIFPWPTLTEDVDDVDSWAYLENGEVYDSTRLAITWTTRDPDFTGDDLGWASRRGIAHSYVSYRAVGETTWSDEEETVKFRALGFMGTWSWFYPARYITTNGLYEIKLISEDVDGFRSDEVWTIQVAMP